LIHASEFRFAGVPGPGHGAQISERLSRSASLLAGRLDRHRRVARRPPCKSRPQEG